MPLKVIRVPIPTAYVVAIRSSKKLIKMAMLLILYKLAARYLPFIKNSSDTSNSRKKKVTPDHTKIQERHKQQLIQDKRKSVQPDHARKEASIEKRQAPSLTEKQLVAINKKRQLLYKQQKVKEAIRRNEERKAAKKLKAFQKKYSPVKHLKTILE